MPFQSQERVPQTNGMPDTEQYYDRTTPSLNIFATPLSFPIDDSALMTINFNTKNQLQNWQNFVSSLGTFKTLTDRIRAENERKRYTEGMLAASQGLGLPERAAKAYTDGYYAYQASLDFQTYSTALQLFAAENMGTWKTQEEVEQALNNFTNQFLEARPINDTYLNAILPAVLDQNSAIINAWTQQAVYRIQEDIVNTSIAGIQKTADDVLETGLKEYLGVSSLEVLANDPEFLETGITNPDIHELLREGLTQAQSDAETMGFTKSDASEIYVHRVGVMAVQYGMPELLDFTSIPDENGIALDQTILSEAILEYRNRASQVKNQKLAALSELRSQQETIFYDQFYKNVFSDISTLVYLSKVDPVLAREHALELREELFKEDSPLWQLSESNFRNITETLNSLVFDRATFPDTSVDTVLIDLRKKTYNGELTLEELNTALANGELSQRDYLDLYDDYQSSVAEREKNRRQYFETIIANESRLFPIDESEVLSILYDQNISPATKDRVVSNHLAQIEKKARTEEELEKQAQATEEAARAQLQKENYITYLMQLSTGQILPSEELTFTIYQETINGNLNPSDGEKLINRVESLIDEADKQKINSIYGPYTNKALTSLAESVIDRYSSDPILNIINPGLKALMEEYHLELDIAFRETFGTNPENAWELYKEHVIEPLREYGSDEFARVYGSYRPSYIDATIPPIPEMTLGSWQLPTPTTSPQRSATQPAPIGTRQTTGVQPTPTPQETLTRTTPAENIPEQVPLTAPATSQAASTERAIQQEPLNIPQPVLEIPKQTKVAPQEMVSNSIFNSLRDTTAPKANIMNLKEQLLIEGYDETGADDLIFSTTIQNVRQYVIENNLPRDIGTRITLEMNLVGMGFTPDEAQYILRQAGVIR